MEDNVMTGTVIWFNEKKGLGFIQRDDGEKDLFCHFSNIVAEEGAFRTLTPGSKVSFTVGENHRGIQAENVVVLEKVKRLR